MSQAIRDHINEIVRDARALASATLQMPKSDREYLIACGRYRQMLDEARRLQDKFLQAEIQESELPDDPDDQPPPRRVSPQRDRVDQVRARHRPRQM